MIARIYIAKELEVRKKAALEYLTSLGILVPSPDLLIIDKEKGLGMEVAKQIKAHVLTKPISSDYRVVFIVQADKLTPEAQNSLLKILEEPAENTLIILGGGSENSFLPTILSRVESFRIPEEKTEIDFKEVDNFLEASTEARYLVIEKIENKEEFFYKLLEKVRVLVKREPNMLKVLEEISDVEGFIKSNVNMRASLEYLALILPKMQ